MDGGSECALVVAEQLCKELMSNDSNFGSVLMYSNWKRTEEMRTWL